MNREDFVIGKSYKDLKNTEWVVVNKDDAFVYCRLKNGGPIPKKFKRAVFADVNAATFDFSTNRILATKIEARIDPEIDGTLRTCTEELNTHGETYVNLFKRNH